MKALHTITAALLLSMASTSIAETSVYSKLADEDIEMCARAENIAEKVLTSRLNGKSITGLIIEARAEEKDHWGLAYRMEVIESMRDMPVVPLDAIGDTSIDAFRAMVITKLKDSISTACLDSLIEDKEELAKQKALSPNRLQALRRQYVTLIEQEVERNWSRPDTSTADMTCEVIVTQTSLGDVMSVSFQQCTNDSAFQRSIERAVRKASPLPPPPNPEVFDREIHFTFAPGDY